MEQLRIYFAHPVTMYETPRETEVLNLIQKKYPNSIIYNPGAKKFQDLFSKYRDQHPDDYMKFFFDIVGKCDMVITYPFEDGTIGAGKGKEMEHGYNNGLEIYLIDNKTLEFNKVNDMNDIDIMSVEETRNKIKQIKGIK